MMPTEAERRGDFSQFRDLNGNLILIRDPLTASRSRATSSPPPASTRTGWRC